jgi:hypothetical protein
MTDRCPLCGEVIEFGHRCESAVRVPEFAPLSPEAVAALTPIYRTPEARRLYMKSYMKDWRAKRKMNGA